MSNATIRVDDSGLFCLNDLHRASGGLSRHRPHDFLRNEHTRALIAQLSPAGNPSTCVQTRPGRTGGTYASKPLASAYAAWIGPSFHAQVWPALSANKPQRTAAKAPAPETRLSICKTTIRTDADGRYCLNDLHRASGGEKRHGPSYWLANAQARELIEELKGPTGIPAGPVTTVNDGINNGTYVAKELVYAYAMWISPRFHLQVIRAYDAMVSAPATAPAASHVDLLSDPAAMRHLLLGYTEKVMALQGQVNTLEPKAAALDLIADSSGSMSLRESAKILNMSERDFVRWAHKHRFIFRTGQGPWQPYADKITAKLLEHRIVGLPSGAITAQARITRLGLATLAQLAAQTMPHGQPPGSRSRHFSSAK